MTTTGGIILACAAALVVVTPLLAYLYARAATLGRLHAEDEYLRRTAGRCVRTMSQQDHKKGKTNE
jgi:hypothetical protein